MVNVLFIPKETFQSDDWEDFMFGKNKKEDTTYGIIGLGRFGSALARELAESGADLIVLDQDEEKVREMRDLTENAFVVKNLDKKTLLETGIQNSSVAVVCIGEALDTSILATLNLVSFGIHTVISKATSAEHGEILEKLGADVVYPERDMAIRIAQRLENARTLDFVQLVTIALSQGNRLIAQTGQCLIHTVNDCRSLDSGSILFTILHNLSFQSVKTAGYLQGGYIILVVLGFL